MAKKRLLRLLTGVMAFSLAFTSVPATVGHAEEASGKEEDLQGTYPTLEEVIESNKQSFAPYGEDEVVEFIVELEGKSLLETKAQNVSLSSYLDTAKGIAALKSIENEQAAVKQEINRSRAAGIKIEYTYKLVTNGLAVRAPYSEKENLESIPGVKRVYVAQTHEYVEPTSGYTKAVHTSGAMMDSDRANEEGYTGKGTVTAVLDTGLDINHAAFANAPESPRYTEAMVKDAVNSNGLHANASAGELYKSEKIPFAYDYADKDTDVSDSQGHGTHVSGSVGADCDALTGVAPDTQVMMMKVFSDASSGASDVWIMAALEDCVLLGVDTINMSLGTGAGFSRESDEAISQVYDRVEAQGINLMCAAGNDTSSAYMNASGTDMNPITEPDNGVVGSPSTYDAALSVASINENTVYSVYFKAGENKINFNDSASDDKLKFVNALNGQTVEYVVVPGYGEASDFRSVDVKGKVALVARGSIAFTEKEKNASDAGAIAMICFNNVDGEAVNMQSGGLIPMVSITKADGAILRKLSDKKITVSDEFAEDMPSAVGSEMSDFSSLGVAPDLTLKPEITAPGGNVYSTMPGGSYGNMSGTSMASPHMAGAASVMKQYVNEAFSSCSSVEKQQLINNLLMSTAVPVKDPSGVYYTPRKQGSGLAEVYNAIHTDAYLTVDGNERPKAELKDNENGTFSFTFRIHNIGKEELTYDISAAPLTAKVETVLGKKYVSESSRELPASEFSVSFSQSKVTVPAGGEAAVSVKMQLTDAGKAKLADFTNGTFLDGFIFAESENEDGIDLSLPYLGFYGNWADAPMYDATIYDENAAYTYEMSGMYQIDITDYSGYPMGINLVSGDLSKADKNKIAVASSSLQYDRLFPILGMFRGSKETDYVVTDADGNVVFDESAGNVSKSFYYASGGFFTYDLPEKGWAPIYYNEEGYWNYLPDGQYTYTVTGHVDGKGEEGTQSISFPVLIDNKAPELVSHRYYETEDGTPMLEVTVKDDNYLMGLQLCTEGGKDGIGKAVAIESTAQGADTVYTFDLTDAIELGVSYGTVVMMDYAQNVSVSQTMSFISQDIEAQSVKINQQQMTCMLDTKPFQLSATVYPEDAVDRSIVWSSENEDVVTIDQDGWVTPVGPGTAVIRATASNGVYGTTEIVVNDSATELPSDFVIREDGRYRLPADLSKAVTITDHAQNVTLVGAPAKTAENPYKNISFNSEVANLNLTIENLNATANGGSAPAVITFKGEGNKLILKGNNNLQAADGAYVSKALVNVPEDAELTVEGTGTLSLFLGSASYGAGIGANPGRVSGKITVNSGTINGTSYGSGSLIGGTGYGAGKITINGGKFDLSVPYKSSWPSNLNACGAAIGDGNRSNKKGTVEIEINDGEIKGSTAVQAAVIGTGHYSTITATVTVNGGKLDLKSISGTGDTTIGGSCIGTGDQGVALGRVTINGGEIIATTESGAAAIGGGAGTEGCTVVINGGTVTATSNTTDVPAIGKGIYISSGSDGALVVNGGSLKANSLPFSTIQNEDYDDVHKTLVYAPNVKSIVVDGKDYKVTANHPEDENLHLWMTEGKHDVIATTADGTKNYEVEVTSTGEYLAKEYYTVQYALTGITADGEAKAYAGESYKATLTAEEGKRLPESISVVMGDAAVDNAYDAAAGTITIDNVTGNLVITAEAVLVPADKEELNAVIAEAEGKQADTYTTDSWNALQTALEAARVVAADESATQTAVDEAKAALQKALDELTERGNKEELIALIATTDAYVQDDYTSGTWNTYADALAKAKEVAENVDATQTEIDEAKEALSTAIANLIRKGDKAALNALIETAEALEQDAYTTDSWNALQNALTAAKEVAEKEEPLQDEVDNAADILRAALDNMVKRGDKTALTAAVAEAEALDETAYTTDSWTAFQETLTAAKAVLDNADATQSDADQALEALQNAVNALAKLGDKTELEALIAEVEASEEEQYTTDSWAAFQEALEAAKAADEKEQATEEEVEAAKTALQSAYEALVKRGDKQALQETIAAAEKLEEDAYTPGSWAAMQSALAAAKAVAENQDATQEEVDAAKAALDASVSGLVKKADKSELNTAITEAEKLNQAEYTDESWAAFENALTSAKEAAADANVSQEKVNAAKDALNAAVSGLKKPAAEVPSDGEPSNGQANGGQSNNGGQNGSQNNGGGQSTGQTTGNGQTTGQTDTKTADSSASQTSTAQNAPKTDDVQTGAAPLVGLLLGAVCLAAAFRKKREQF